MTNFTTMADIINCRKEDTAKGIVFIKEDNQDRFVSYQEIYHGSLRVLHNLQHKGVKPESELVFQIYDNEQYVYLFWACILGKIIPVPLTYATKDDARDKIFKVWNYLKNPYLAIDRTSLAQFDESYADQMASIKPKILPVEGLMGFRKEGAIVKSTPEDIAYLQFSSGSTGDPKGIVLSHKNVLANTREVLKACNINDEDVSLSWMPMTHDMGLLGFHIMPMAAGEMQYVMTPAEFIADPMIWLRRAHKHRATYTCSPNFGYRYFLKNYDAGAATDWDLSCIRMIFNGAEPISIELCHTFLDKMKAHGLKRTAMFPAYGLSEATTTVALPPLDQELKFVNIDRSRTHYGKKVRIVAAEDPKALQVADCGRALPGSPFRIADNDNIVLNDYCIGNIHISGPNVTAGYYNRPDKTREIITDDGWLNTEDLGFMVNGSLFITGRVKDIIFVNGKNYYSHDLEEFAQKVPGVGYGKAAAVGARKPDNSEDDIIVFIVYKGDDFNTFIDIAGKVRNAISSHSGLTVKHVIPVSFIPRTTSGKPQRYQLREAFQTGQFNHIILKLEPLKEKRVSQLIPPETETEEQIAVIWRQLLSQENIGCMDNFFDIGGTSLLAVDLHRKLQNLFRLEFPIALLYEHMTISYMAKYLNSVTKSAPDIAEKMLNDMVDPQKQDLIRREKRRALRRRQFHE